MKHMRVLSFISLIKYFILMYFFFILKIMDPQRREEKSQAAAEMKNKLSQNVAQSRFANGPTKSRQLPTAEEAKRIAKIFSSKHSK